MLLIPLCFPPESFDSNGKIVFPTCFTERPSNLKSFLSEHLLLKNLSYNYLCFVSFFIRFSKSICLYFKVSLLVLVGPSGLEPPTSCLSGTRSNLLSYDPMWLAWRFVHTRLFFRFGEGFASFPSSVSALSYFPVPSPAKYLQHCRA